MIQIFNFAKSKIANVAPLFLMLATLGLLTACDEEGHNKPPVGKPTGKVAYATLNPTQGSTAKGTVKFIQLDEGVKVVAEIEGIDPGEHGFHIHEFGDCSAPDAKSAGGHFNPHNTLHGSPLDLPRHVGDLGNVAANKNGKAIYQYVDFLIKLEGPDSIIGKSVIVHKDRDDFTSQPSGNAGARLACGLIIEGEPKK